jgi:uncharacterized SAM-binding protein YcdF (DUF218 family)
MLFNLRVLLFHDLLLPPTVLLLAALISFGFLFSRWKRPATIVLGASLGLLWLLSLPVVAQGLWRLTERYPPLDLRQPVTAQAIVVIGGSGFRPEAPEYGGPVAQAGLLERLTYTAYLARRTQLPVLVSGHEDEALAMRDTLERNFGIKARWVERHSRDTFENAEESVKLLRADGIQRIILVTSSTHIWRASHEFSATGLTVQPAPAVLWAPHLTRGLENFLPSADSLVRSREALYELAGEPVRATLSGLHMRRHKT